MLGSRCNYDCMYCDREWHDMTSDQHDLEVLKKAWSNIYDKTSDLGLPYKISFTGGEVTVNKSFLPLIQWLKSEYDIAMIFVSTNGSASLRYYQDLCDKIDAISFSLHSEHVNEKEFFEKIEILNLLMVRFNKTLHVNIMDEIWNRARIPLYQQRLKSQGIDHSINPIDYRHQTRTFPIMKGELNLESI